MEQFQYKISEEIVYYILMILKDPQIYDYDY